MSQLDDLNAVVTELGTDVASIKTDVATVLAQLQGLQSKLGNIDPSQPIAALTNLHATLSGVDASLKAAETPATTPVA